MKSRLTRMLWIALLLGAQSAAAQSPPATGSITVLSRPSGAAFRLSGEQVVVGRTPMTIDRGLVGRYELRTLDPGYGTWSRTLMLSGISADTVWITLHPRSAAGAGLRSLVMPGWGQGYGHHPTRGVLFFCATAVVGAGLAFTEVRYQDRLDTYRDADAAYQSATTSATIAAAYDVRARASDRAEDAYKLRLIAFGTLCGVWGLNVIEAMFHFPSLPSDRMSLSITPPDPGLRPMPMATLTVRF